MSGRKNLASKYLEAIGSSDVLPKSPLQPSQSRANVSPLKRSPTKSELTLSSKENKEPASPVKRLILQKEKDTVDNHASEFHPAPDMTASTTKFQGFSKSKKGSDNPTKTEARKMSEINSAMSNSPSLKNLNKLKAIEGKLTTNRQRSVSGMQHRLDGIGEERTATVYASKQLEFVCRLFEVKTWVEQVLDKELDIDEANISQFQNYFRNGVLLAEIIQKLQSDSIKGIYYGQKSDGDLKYTNKKGLYFKFTENIVQFLNYLRGVELPEMFIFETTDLFEMRNFPKVIFCIQALSYMLAMKGKAPSLRRVVPSEINVSDEQLKAVSSQIRGLRLPNFETIYDGVRVNVGTDIRPVSLIEERPYEEAAEEQKDEAPAMEVPKKRSVRASPKPSVRAVSKHSIRTVSRRAASKRAVSDDFQDAEETIQDTKEARTLFKDFNPTIDVDMDAIEQKYSKLIQDDDVLNYHPQERKMSISGIPDADIIALQALARGAIVRYNLFVNRFMFKVFTPDVITFQSHIRGALLRRRIAHPEEKQLPAPPRKVIVRSARLKMRRRKPVPVVPVHTVATKKPADDLLKKSEKEQDTFTQFEAFARGYLVRKDVNRKRQYLKKRAGAITELQSAFRGSLTRFYLELRNDKLKEESDSVTQLQALIRGTLTRYRIEDREEYFRRPSNVDKIIKVQNLFRATVASSDYKQLINEKNPPLKAVKHYASLLSASDEDVAEEVQLGKYKVRINAETKRIDRCEQELKQLGIKLQLLNKNKISLQEVVQFKEDALNLSEYSQNLNNLMNSSLSSNPDKIVDKSCKNLLGMYGRIFYLLQTKPDYFSGILHSIDFSGLDEELPSGHIEDWILKCFNYSMLSPETTTRPTREEFLLMKLVLFESNKSFAELKTTSEFHTLLRQRQSLKFEDAKQWEILLNGYISQPQQRLLAKNLFSSVILMITSDSDAWYESDARKICLALQAEDEKEGKITLNDLNDSDPIEDPETRDQFVRNLSDLREASYDAMKQIGALADKVPLFIRSVCREVYHQVKLQFPSESEKYYLSTVGSLFMKSYVLPLFTNPENYSINVISLSDDVDTVEKIMRNLEQVGKVLNQLVLLRPFASSELYMQPLNPFIEEFTDQVRDIIKKLIDIPRIDEAYQMSSVYDDVASHEKPVLKMYSEEVIPMLEYIEDKVDFFAPARNDYLRYLLLAARGLESNYHNLELNKDMLEITLQPITESTNSRELENRTLLMEAKRSIIYILQVQDGEDLLDLLLSEITPRNELRFKEIVMEEKGKRMDKSIRGMESVVDRQAIDDVYSSTYPQVKKHAIELVLELERKGVVTRTDGYQKLLNELAHDIKTKKAQGEARDRRLKVAVDTLTKLTQKEKTCTKLYNEYIKDIDTAMLNLQKSSTGKKKLISKLFSRQYYNQLLLKHKNGYLPRYGAYKYDGKTLQDKGILEEVSNVKPSKIRFMISSEKQAEFNVEVSGGDRSAKETVTLDYLLDLQYENKEQFEMFGGSAVFNTDKFVTLIFHKFYSVA